MIRKHPEDGIQFIREFDEHLDEVEFSVKDGWLCMHFTQGYMQPIYYIGNFYPKD